MAHLHSIQQCLDFIEEHLEDPLTPESLARRFHYSPAHFSRLFEHATGLSMMRYILRRRLVHSAFQLTRGQRVTDVALRFGFDTAAGFYKAFRRENGMPPSRFARKFPVQQPAPVRLDQEVYPMLSMQDIRSVLRHWDMENVPVFPIVYRSGAVSDHSWQAGDDCVLQCYAHPGTLNLAARMAHQLSAQGFDAPVHIPTPDGRPSVPYGDACFALTRRIPGESKTQPDEQEAFALGQAVGKLHHILCQEPEDLYPHQNIFREVEDMWLRPSAKALSLTDDFVRQYLDAMRRLNPQLPCHPIHRDLNPDSIRWQQHAVTGFAEFQLSRSCARVFDLCYAATALLCDWIEDAPTARDNWPKLFCHIARGYDSVNALSDAEKEALPYMALTVQFTCVGYFSTVDKYHALARKNEAMTRFMLAHFSELSIS